MSEAKNIAVRVEGIRKSYGEKRALKGISFEVNSGELFGLIGADGAGKSTLFRILTTLLLPDEGAASVAGVDVVKDFWRLRSKIGYMPGKFSLYQDLSVEENLEFFASVFGTTVQANYELIKDIYQQIEPFKTRRAGALSGGMKQKLALSCALIHKPNVLFLDEPTTGVDAVSRKEFWQMLKKLKENGITILVSTPYMDEASLCERVALIQNGTLLGIDSPEHITNQFERPLFAVKAENMPRLISVLRALPNAHTVYAFGEYLHYTDKRQADCSKELREFLQKKGFQKVEVLPIKPSIEDTFMDLMEKKGAGDNG
ncbi:ABC transporter-related protein [Chloroherpeton thalassium ATCC 35110]|uniref:ABC transporter-related protein n=1 Tax=Chloroherpeton thalassium (strain ATCC 35110 / GB-78) TaxID=517418 RepID=B3QZ85_CHLT3|nr:ABC transporter ATP-binding protein [Chloroherpeton thalassium]ACF13778.1 ABC transporter-related protein [Chloroherpeton thalassium ATCC 35110]